MRVIATAGHVDHGKSALVESLTGTHPDRLKEERERAMTIDLGFGYFTLPGAGETALVDVPGHRDFIENMLAGVGGVDAALLAVAADEGPMPQTREHLAILDLLGIDAGVAALTKIDLVPNAEERAVARADLERLLSGTALAAIPIHEVSAKTGEGMDALRVALDDCLQSRPTRPDLGRPRLAIDRVFTLPGFGTVVTGTLLDGRLQTGQEVELLPGGRRARIRSLQSHYHELRQAEPGSRVAVNLSGVDVSDVRRGQVVSGIGAYAPSELLDLRVRLLADSSRPLRHNDELKLFLGTAETMARIRVLGAEEIAPGGEGWAQAVLAAPLPAARGDRMIVRIPSPGETVGGAVVVDPAPARKHRRYEHGLVESLDARLGAGPEAALLRELKQAGILSAAEAAGRLQVGEEEAARLIRVLEGSGSVIRLAGGELAVSMAGWQILKTQILDWMVRRHHENPMREAVPREELRKRLGMPVKTFAAVLARAGADGWLAETPRGVKMAGYVPQFTAAQQQIVQALLAQFDADPYNPPSVKDCRHDAGADLYAALVENGTLKQVGADVVFLAATYAAMVDRIRRALRESGPLTVAATRDLFGSSRKYILALLEHLDAEGITMRDGDLRKPGKKSVGL